MRVPSVASILAFLPPSPRTGLPILLGALVVAAPSVVTAQQPIPEPHAGIAPPRTIPTGTAHSGMAGPTAGQSAAAALMTRAGVALQGVSYGASTAIGDMNEDGHQDLVVTGLTPNDVPFSTLYLGNEDGSYSAANADLMDVWRSASAIADFNEDGHPDLLLSGLTPNGPAASVYLGNGDGTFTTADAGLTGTASSAMSVADVDDDGHLDVLLIGWTGSASSPSITATLYLGNGDGTFSDAGANLTGVFRGSTSIADVDGDDHLDLLVTGATELSDPHAPTSTIYLGNGDGSFDEAGANLTGVYMSATSIADVNEDGHSDVLLTGNAGGPFHGPTPTATLYLGNGDGSFDEAGAGLTNVSRSDAAIADLNADGHDDLVVAGDDSTLTPTATVYLGTDSGSFTEADAGLTGVRFASMATGDIGGDGDPDLLVAGGDDTGFLALPSTRLYVNRTQQSSPNRSPRFSKPLAPTRLAPGVPVDLTVEAGDPDGDAVSLSAPQSPPGLSLTDRGNGVARVRYAPPRSEGGNTVNLGLEATDAAGATASVSAQLTVPPVVATYSAGFTDVYHASAATGDVNNDSIPDALITGLDSTRTRVTTLYLGNGDGTFDRANADLTAVGFGSSVITDVDEDDNQDLIVTGNAGTRFSPTPTTTLYLGNGDSTFSEANAGLSGVWLGDISTGDVDEDGHTDLLIIGITSDGSPSSTLYLGNGDGSFSEANANLPTVADGATALADVNGDSHLDVLIAGRADGPLTQVHLGNGDGTFDRANADLTRVSDGTISTGDVNDDGHTDVLVTGWDATFTPTSTLYLGNGDGSFEEAGADLLGVADNGATAIGDVNDDDHSDLLITGRDGTSRLSFSGTRTATLYLGNGDGTFSAANAGLAGNEDGSIGLADVEGDGDTDFVITGFSSTTRRQSTLVYENLFDNPLPVELTAFGATVDGEAVRLTWQTASETGNARFEVQRRVASTPGVRRVGGEERGNAGAWEQIGQVEGSGTTTEARSYRFVDSDLPYEADRLDYRLRQVDTDGSAKFSKTVTVERSVDDVELLGTYPNPTESRATVRYALPKRQAVTVRLYDVLGRQVRTVVQGQQEGRQTYPLDTSTLPSGTYFLRLQAGDQTRTQKLTVVQ